MVIKNGTVLTNDELKKVDVSIEGDVICQVSENIDKKSDFVLDCLGLYVFPGFIDSHVHGGGGGDSCTQTVEAYSKIVKSQIRFGTTSIVLAVGGMSDDIVHNSVSLIKEINSENQGAEILGLHLEGPWINLAKCGAIPKDNLDPSVSLMRLENLISGYENDICTITLAPELPNMDVVIPYLKSKGIVVSIGHTNANFAEANRAVELGATCFTHLFNTSQALSAREPSVVGCALNNEDCYAEIIADGYHVHPANINIAIAMKKSHLVLMTDAIEVTGTDATKFSLPGLDEVLVHDGRTWGPNDSLIGSILTQQTALKNILKWGYADLVSTINMLTKNPAKLLGLYPNRGSIQNGSVANFTIMNSDFEVIYTVVHGKVLYSK